MRLEQQPKGIAIRRRDQVRGLLLAQDLQLGQDVQLAKSEQLGLDVPGAIGLQFLAGVRGHRESGHG